MSTLPAIHCELTRINDKLGELLALLKTHIQNNPPQGDADERNA